MILSGLLGIYAMIRRHFIGGIILFLAGVYFLIGNAMLSLEDVMTNAGKMGM